MHFEHYCRGLFTSHQKKPFQYMNDEFHRREVIV
jgi:hypothetical protein